MSDPIDTSTAAVEQCESDEIVRALTAVVREADAVFERVGGGSRHWVRDCFLPLLNQSGWRITVPATWLPRRGGPLAEWTHEPVSDESDVPEPIRSHLMGAAIVTGCNYYWLCAIYRAGHSALVAERDTLAAQLREAEAKVRALEDARERTEDYIRTAMRPISVKEACGEGIWDRAHRSGLQHGLNALIAEFGKVSEAVPARAREQE